MVTNCIAAAAGSAAGATSQPGRAVPLPSQHRDPLQTAQQAQALHPHCLPRPLPDLSVPSRVEPLLQHQKPVPTLPCQGQPDPSRQHSSAQLSSLSCSQHCRGMQAGQGAGTRMGRVGLTLSTQSKPWQRAAGTGQGLSREHSPDKSQPLPQQGHCSWVLPARPLEQALEGAGQDSVCLDLLLPR